MSFLYLTLALLLDGWRDEMDTICTFSCCSHWKLTSCASTKPIHLLHSNKQSCCTRKLHIWYCPRTIHNLERKRRTFQDTFFFYNFFLFSNQIQWSTSTWEACSVQCLLRTSNPSNLLLFYAYGSWNIIMLLFTACLHLQLSTNFGTRERLGLGDQVPCRSICLHYPLNVGRRGYTLHNRMHQMTTT